jgi:hypothetical protein
MRVHSVSRIRFRQAKADFTLVLLAPAYKHGSGTCDEGELFCDGAGEHNLLQEPQDRAHHALPYFRRGLDAVSELQEPVSLVIGLGSAVSLLDLSTFWRDQ